MMTTESKIKDEKLQLDIKIEAAKISDKIDKYEYLTDEEILASDKRRVIEQTNSTYSLLGKALQKETRTNEDPDEKQIKEVEDHGKQLVESNELIKKHFNIDRDIGYCLKNNSKNI